MTFQLQTSSGFTRRPSGKMSEPNRSRKYKLVRNPITQIVDDAVYANWDFTGMTTFSFQNFLAENDVLNTSGVVSSIYAYTASSATEYMERTFSSNVSIEPTEPLNFVFNIFGYPSVLSTDGIRIYLYHDGADYTQYSSWYFRAQQCTLNWNVLSVVPDWINRGDLGADGLDPDKTGWVAGPGGHFDPSAGIKRIRIEYVDMRVVAGPIYCGCYTGGGHTPCVVMIFDDGSDSIFDTPYDNSDNLGSISVVERMQHWGLPGTCGIIRDSVGGGSSMTAAEIKQLHSYGWDIIVHGDDNIPWTNAPPNNPFTTEENAFTDDPSTGEGDSVLYNRQWLLDNGFWETSQHFVYPRNDYRGGNLHDALLARLSLEGFQTGRASWPQISRIDPNLGAGYEPDWLSYPGALIESTTGLWEQQQWFFDCIDEWAIACNRAVFPVLHTILGSNNPDSVNRPPPGSSTYYRDDAAILINKIGQDVRDGNLVALTVSEWYENMKAMCNGG